MQSCFPVADSIRNFPQRRDVFCGLRGSLSLTEPARFPSALHSVTKPTSYVSPLCSPSGHSGPRRRPRRPRLLWLHGLHRCARLRMCAAPAAGANHRPSPAHADEKLWLLCCSAHTGVTHDADGHAGGETSKTDRETRAEVSEALEVAVASACLDWKEGKHRVSRCGARELSNSTSS